MEFNKNYIIEFGSKSLVISPKNKIIMDGFAGREDSFKGINLDIFAKAFVFKINNNLFSIVSVECLGLPELFEIQVLNRINKTLNIKLSNLIITFTHTHSAPKIKGITPTIFSRNFTKIEKRQINKYYKYIIDKVVKIILDASKKLTRCKVVYTLGQANFSSNRRMHKGPKNSKLPIFYIYNLKNKIIGILFNYTCHCVNQKNQYISGDWAGYAQMYTEKYFSDSICIATIGCAADQNPNRGVGYINSKFAKMNGKKIAKEIIKKSCSSNKTYLHGTFAAFSKRIYLKYNKIPSYKELYGKSKFDSPEGFNSYYQLQKIKKYKKLVNKIKYDVTIWKFLNIYIIFLPDEVCIDYYLLTKKIFNNSLVISYCRYLRGYIPSKRLLKEGGYGAGEEIHFFGLPSKFEIKTEQNIIKTLRFFKKDKFFFNI